MLRAALSGVLVWGLLSGCERGPGPSVPPPAPPPVETGPAPAAKPTLSARQAHMLELVAFVDEVFAHRYAPTQFKRDRLEWSREAEIKKLRALVLSKVPPPTRAFQRGLFRFFRSMRDIHTDVSLEKDRAVWAGVRIRKIGERYLLSCIDREHLPKERFPFEVGDEVVSFGRVEITKAVQEAKEQAQYYSTPGFEQRLAELVLTTRTEREWDRVPVTGDKVDIVVRSADAKSASKPPATRSIPWLDYDAAPPAKACPSVKSKQGTLPTLGTIRWRPKSAQHYASYLFHHGGKRYGYLRFHSYGLEGSDRLGALSQLDGALQSFRELGAQKLVIDQTGNGGGNYLLAYTLFSRLTAKKLAVPKQQFLIDRGRVIGLGPLEVLAGVSKGLASVSSDDGAAKLMATHPLFSTGLDFLPKRRSSIEHFRGFLDFFQTRKWLGHQLTEPHYQVLPYIEPILDAKPFDKPIVLVIDEWNISAAEYAAAALRDSGRAQLVGATTAGAGGDQRKILSSRVCGSEKVPLDGLTPCAPPKVAVAMQALGIRSFSYTVTLGTRANAAGKPTHPIENRGVEPHVRHAWTVADLKDKQASLRATILKLLAAP